MLKPLPSELLKKNENYYSFVMGIAKRARQISEYSDIEKSKKPIAECEEIVKRACDEKTVSMALEEYTNGDFVIEAK
jgi:DNA-directed RNA polymerase omega subunit